MKAIIVAAFVTACIILVSGGMIATSILIQTCGQ